MSRDPKVIRFRQDARRPRWRRAQSQVRRRKPIRTKAWVAAIAGAVVIGPSVADAVNGLVKPYEGCRVVSVVDGDTVKAICPGVGYTSARLLGYDTPEIHGQCAMESAKAFAAAQLLRWRLYRAGHIRLWPRKTDKYDRQLVMAAVDGESLAQKMIEAGLARPYDGGRRAGWCD